MEVPEVVGLKKGPQIWTFLLAPSGLPNSNWNHSRLYWKLQVETRYLLYNIMSENMAIIKKRMEPGLVSGPIFLKWEII